MVHAIKMGWMKPRQPKKTEEEEEEAKHVRYDLWADDAEDNILKRYRQRIPAPKTPLPGHSESYNPPKEYLFSKEEVGTGVVVVVVVVVSCCQATASRTTPRKSISSLRKR